MLKPTNPKPKWLRRRLPSSWDNKELNDLISSHNLHTVCVEANCPNQMECFSRREATILLLGPTCSRQCTFCSVNKGKIKTPLQTPLNHKTPQKLLKKWV